MESNTLLFGGSGFFGPVILGQYPEIISVGRTPPPNYVKNRHIQLDDLDHLEILDEVNFDKVICLIGSSDHHYLNSSITAGIDFNVYPLKKILSYLSKRELKKFICFTSILLYDAKKIQIPVDEKQEINPYTNEYIFSKFLSEKIVDFYSHKVPSITIRCSNIYGPTKLTRPDLVPTLVQKLLSDNDVTVWNKKPIRDFIYLEDAAEAIVKLLHSEFTGTVNLGTGKSESIGEICSILEHISGRKIIDLNLEVSGPMNFCCDITKLRSIIDWYPRHSLKSGIEETFLQMQDWSREIK
jgi:nucleoside-diphosphate-sugar epimerase